MMKKAATLLTMATLALAGCAYQLGDARPSMMRGITTLDEVFRVSKRTE